MNGQVRRGFAPTRRPVMVWCMAMGMLVWAACGDNSGPEPYVEYTIVTAIEQPDGSYFVNRPTASVFLADSIVVAARLLVDSVPTAFNRPVWRSASGTIATITPLANPLGDGWARLSVKGTATGQTQLIATSKGAADTIVVFVLPRPTASGMR